MFYQWLFFATLVANAPPATPPPPPTYISDRLSVPLHGANAIDAPVVKQVIGGLPIKVLSRDGALVKIRTDDGSVGWVEPEFVTTDTPMHVLYLDVTERFAKAQETLKSLEQHPGTSVAPRDESKIVSDLRAEVKNTLEHAVELEKHIRDIRDNGKQSYESTIRLRELEVENAGLRAQLEAKPNVTPAPREAGNFFPSGTLPMAPSFSARLMSFMGLGLGLILGVIAGWWMMSRRARKKLGESQANPHV